MSLALDSRWNVAIRLRRKLGDAAELALLGGHYSISRWRQCRLKHFFDILAFTRKLVTEMRGVLWQPNVLLEIFALRDLSSLQKDTRLCVNCDDVVLFYFCPYIEGRSIESQIGSDRREVEIIEYDPIDGEMWPHKTILNFNDIWICVILDDDNN
jgi:hypothetical protein